MKHLDQLPDDVLRKVGTQFAQNVFIARVAQSYRSNDGSYYSVEVTRSEFTAYMAVREGRSVKVPVGIAGSKPICPDHDDEMTYDPEKGYWVCPKYLCGKKARMRLNIDDVSGTVLSGDIHLYSTGTGDDEKYYLYIRQLNVFIDVNDILHRETTGRVHGTKGSYHLGLAFSELHNRD